MTINTSVRKLLILKRFQDFWDFLGMHKQLDTKKIYLYLKDKGESVSIDAVYKTLYQMESEKLIERKNRKWQITDYGLKKIPELNLELKEYFNTIEKQSEKSKHLWGQNGI